MNIDQKYCWQSKTELFLHKYFLICCQTTSLSKLAWINKINQQLIRYRPNYPFKTFFSLKFLKKIATNPFFLFSLRQRIIIIIEPSNKNPAYGRHQLSRPMRIVGPIQFWRGCMIYRSAPKSGLDPRENADSVHAKVGTRSTQKGWLGSLRNTSPFLGLYSRSSVHNLVSKI